MLTYEYKLYHSKRNRKLDAMLREACFVWNHALALQKRYYSLTGKYCPCGRMKAHYAKRIHRHLLHSQTVQEILERLDESYKRFFNHLAKRPPKFKRVSEFTSIVWKQGGYKLNANVFVVNSIRQQFQFSYSRPYEGKVKTVRIKRSHLGEYYLYIVTDAVAQPCRKSHDGASAGMDFGLKDFLTLSDGTRYVNELLTLSDRSWTCSVCGTSHDRDVNAAKNILRQGIASSGSPCKTRLAGRGASATGESH